MTGRKPTPISVTPKKYHRSNEELEERLNNEPTGCDANLNPPRALSNEAKKEWKRLVALYKQLDMPLLNDLDVGILAAYCESRAIFEKAQAEWKKDPQPVVYTDKGPRDNPLIKIMDREGQLIAKYGEQLALSPVSRARVGIAKAKKESDEDPMTALLARGRA